MAEINIEYHPTTAPKPGLFVVTEAGRVLATLSYEQVRHAVDRFDEMRDARAAWDLRLGHNLSSGETK